MLDSKVSWIAPFSLPMGSKGGQESEVAQRLRLLRGALGDVSQKAFAERHGLDAKRYHNFESGLPLSRDAAITLVRHIPGLTLDWLYLGREDGLSFKLASALRTVAEEKAKTGLE